MKTSKGEQKIINILRKEGIKFEREKVLKDYRGGKMRLDFFLYEYNWGIEVQGQQHYKYVSHFHKQTSDFLKSQERDRSKISYCLANGIRLYCIPYWELDNLETKFDLFQDKFRARSKWHNDEVWREFCKK